MADEPPVPLRAVVATLVAVGVALRVWILLEPIGALDSDEAIVGLMARHMLDGEFPLFFWGQSYGGSHEALLTAAVFGVFGASTLGIKLVPLALHAGACVLLWRVGRRTVGEPAATVAAALFWVWPAAFVWWSLKATGFYEVALVLTLLTTVLVLRLAERDSASDMALLGLVVGVGWWSTPQFVFVAAPALVWLAVRRPSVLARSWPAWACALVGVFPWLGFNLVHGWTSFRPPPVFHQPNGYFDHIVVFFREGLPAALGLRVPDGVHWIPPVLGQLWYVALLAAFAVMAARARGNRTLLTAIALCYPFLFAVSSFSWFVSQPKYLLFLGPVLALFVARGLVALPRLPALLGIGFATSLTIASLVIMNAAAYEDPGQAPGAGPAPVDAQLVKMHQDDWLAFRVTPADFGPLVGYLTNNGIEHVYADYWLAYRIAFESDEEVIATPYRGNLRQGEFDAAVRAADEAAYVFVKGTRTDPAFRDGLAALGIPHTRVEVAGFVVYEMPQNVAPETVPIILIAAESGGKPTFSMRSADESRSGGLGRRFRKIEGGGIRR
ncbi:MAG: glycosyltransferase family 39 protein [Actinomycetota bacterium]|nr:glycosyltransferase family 39 protein [Actinomycetota bacterium]